MDFHWAITTLERGGIIERPEGEFVLQYCKRGDHYAYRFRRRESDGPGSTWQETGFTGMIFWRTTGSSSVL